VNSYELGTFFSERLPAAGLVISAFRLERMQGRAAFHSGKKVIRDSARIGILGERLRVFEFIQFYERLTGYYVTKSGQKTYKC